MALKCWTEPFPPTPLPLARPAKLPWHKGTYHITATWHILTGRAVFPWATEIIPIIFAFDVAPFRKWLQSVSTFPHSTICSTHGESWIFTVEKYGQYHALFKQLGPALYKVCFNGFHECGEHFFCALDIMSMIVVIVQRALKRYDHDRISTSFIHVSMCVLYTATLIKCSTYVWMV